MVAKDCDGRSGGLAIFWKREINLHVHTASRRYIDPEVEEKDGFVWRLTGMYGDPRTNHKDFTWKAMRTLNAERRRPWLCLGDFNEVLMGWEKEGM